MAMKNLRNKIAAFVGGILLPLIVFAGLESGTYISDLVSTNPLGSDLASTIDDHIRLLKSTIKTTFPNINGAVNSSDEELNLVDGLSGTIWTSANDGTGSGLNADTLDGNNSSAFATTSTIGKVAFGRSNSSGTLQAGSLNVTSITAGITGQYTIDYTAAGFATIPACQFTPEAAGTSVSQCSKFTPTATSVVINCYTGSSEVAANVAFSFSCHGT